MHYQSYKNAPIVLYYSNLILATGHTHLTQNYQLGCPEGFLPEIKTISTPHNCQFWYNAAVFRSVKSTLKNWVNSLQNSQNWSNFAKFGQHFAFSMLKLTPARKKYTTAGSGGCDKYELCFSLVILHPIKPSERTSGNYSYCSGVCKKNQWYDGFDVCE